MLNILPAFAFLDRRGLIYMDMKLENVMVVDDGQGSTVSKLIDLGAVRRADDTTGDLYALALPPPPKAIVYPVRNPETGKLAFMPVTRNSGGAWTISSRYMGALALIEGEPKALKDPKTGQVTVNNETPKRIK